VKAAEKTSSVLATTLKKWSGVIIELLLVVSFVVAFSILYVLDPGLFQATWIGRTFYIFFLWLVVLEMILNWDNLKKSRLKKMMSMRTALFITVLLLPTLYVVWANYFGGNVLIRNFLLQENVPWGDALLMRIPVEYLVFTVFFVVMVLLAYGLKGLKSFSAATLFLGIVGTLYTVDTTYHGTFTPFQILVPATTTLSAFGLHLMGYKTIVTVGSDATNGSYPVLIASSPTHTASFGIAWACSGIESLLIFTAVAVLFLMASDIRWFYKVSCFAVGALVTYTINILRIIYIFVIQLNGGNYLEFHDYYGPLISVLWITSFPLIIMGIQALSTFIKLRRGAKEPDSN
jgi:exosortase/archaeosortase family protein